MDFRPASEAELDGHYEKIGIWACGLLEGQSDVVGVEGDAENRRWYIRMTGEAKVAYSVLLTLRQRSLHYESYFAPAPEENHGRFYEFLLRRNLDLRLVRFAVGSEAAVFLLGEAPLPTLDEIALDCILGSLTAATERYFRAAMLIGFASRFRS